MKKILLSLLVLSLSVSAQSSGTNNGLSDARTLAEQGIIVNQSTMSSVSGPSLTTDFQEASMYRLGDTIIRQEALGIALKLAKFTLPDKYNCRNYFTDAREWWVCRVAEVSADNKIVSRENLQFRPQDVVTLAESLGILLKSTNPHLTHTKPNYLIWTNISDWQKSLISTLNESGIGSFQFVNGEYRYYFNDTVSYSLSHRMTRGDFFRVAVLFLDAQDPTDHCTVYNDGCNDCAVINGVPACTKRACFWQGIPSCSECEAGYTLENNRCIKKQTSCIAEGGYAGGGFVPYLENMDDFQCCAGLTRAERKDGSTLADAGYTCIREGDNYCDARYESNYNSSDCRTPVTFDASICQNYYDGCNSCSRTENGQTICTMRACLVN